MQTLDYCDMEKAAAVQETAPVNLQLAELFQKGAVLQHGKILPVWGWTMPGSTVIGVLNGKTARTVSSQDGSFMLWFPPQPPAGPVTLEVSSPDEKITVNDVWIGEVILVSGQSNAEFPLGMMNNYAELVSSGELCTDAVSCFKVPLQNYPNRSRRKLNPNSGVACAGTWQTPNGDNIKGFSALGFRCGKNLAEKLGMKVGVIDASRGGSGISCWISPEMLASCGPHQQIMRDFLVRKCDPEFYRDLPEGKQLPDEMRVLDDMVLKLFPEVPENTGLELGYAETDFDDSAWAIGNMPCYWTNLGYNHPGSFWFRKAIDLPGEAAGKPLTLHLGSVDKADITYFNGVEIGRTGDGRDINFWNAQRVYEVPAELVREHNVISVRAYSVFSIAMDGGLGGPANEMYLEGDFGKISLTGAWRYQLEHALTLVACEVQQVAGPGVGNTLGTLFDNMIAPLIPYALGRVLWYQGEYNSLFESDIYAELLEMLVKDWRKQFFDSELDFVICQLPGWQKKQKFLACSTWAPLREAQTAAARKLDLGLLVITDTGDELDIHPQDKFPVGDRVAEQLVRRMNQTDIPFEMITCTKADGVLKLALSRPVESAGENGFAAVDEENRVYYPDFKVNGDQVILSGDLPETGTLYYNWSDFPIGLIMDADGMPLDGFRVKF